MGNNNNAFNNDIVNNYINGEEIENIDELERNPRFMTRVIAKTPESTNYKNNNIIKLCTEEVKRNYPFVSIFIHKFKDSPKAIIELCKEFVRLNHSKRIEDDVLNIETTEILVRTVNYVKSNQRYKEEFMGDLIELGTELNRRYDYNIRKYETQPERVDDFGFRFVCERYDDNPYISDYIANKTLQRIMQDGETAYTLFKIASECTCTEELDTILYDCMCEVASRDMDYAEYVDTRPKVKDQLRKRVGEELKRIFTYNQNASKSRLTEEDSKNIKRLKLDNSDNM